MTYALFYPDYIDTVTHKSVTAIPGSSYTIVLGPGRILATPAFPNDGRWTSVTVFTGLAMPVHGGGAAVTVARAAKAGNGNGTATAMTEGEVA